MSPAPLLEKPPTEMRYVPPGLMLPWPPTTVPGMVKLCVVVRVLLLNWLPYCVLSDWTSCTGVKELGITSSSWPQLTTVVAGCALVQDTWISQAAVGPPPTGVRVTLLTVGTVVPHIAAMAPTSGVITRGCPSSACCALCASLTPDHSAAHQPLGYQLPPCTAMVSWLAGDRAVPPKNTKPEEYHHRSLYMNSVPPSSSALGADGPASLARMSCHRPVLAVCASASSSWLPGGQA